MGNLHKKGREESEILTRIREFRKVRAISLREMAQRTGLSEYYLSQVERAMANPSIGTIKKITGALGIPLMALLAEEEETNKRSSGGTEEVRIVRADKRKTLIYPGSVKRASLLTPDLQGKLEVLLTIEEPEPEGSDEWYSHEGEEFGFILEGRYEVTVEDSVHTLEQGDSICFPSHLRHKMRNPGNGISRTLWVITPPSF